MGYFRAGRRDGGHILATRLKVQHGGKGGSLLIRASRDFNHAGAMGGAATDV
jgi:hypothetical protein